MALSVCDNEIMDSGREKQEHGTHAFPIACYADDLNFADVSWHWHEELELAVVTQGTLQLYAGSDILLLKQGEGFFLNTGILHAAKTVPGTNCQLHSLVFHPRLLGNGIDGIFWQKYIHPLLTNQAVQCIPLSYRISWQKEALSHAEEAWQAVVTESAGYEFAARNALSLFFFAITRHCPAPLPAHQEKTARQNDRIKRMLHYIQEHLAEAVTIHSIAESVSISESECQRCFRAVLGTSPIQYVRSVRLQKAADLLSQSHLPISVIGEKCGFQDMSYFSKAFFQYKQQTPSAYRKNGRNFIASGSGKPIDSKENLRYNKV